MAVLRDQGPQDGHELRRADVLDVDHLRDDLIGAGAHVIRQVDRGKRARIGVRQDLHHVAGLHGDEPMHLQNRQECLIEGRGGHRRRGQHRDLRAHARIEDEILVGGRADGLRDLRDVGVLEVGRDLSRLLCGRQRHHDQGGQRAAKEEAKAIHLDDPSSLERADYCVLSVGLGGSTEGGGEGCP